MLRARTELPQLASLIRGDIRRHVYRVRVVTIPGPRIDRAVFEWNSESRIDQPLHGLPGRGGAHPF